MECARRFLRKKLRQCFERVSDIHIFIGTDRGKLCFPVAEFVSLPEQYRFFGQGNKRD